MTSWISGLVVQAPMAGGPGSPALAAAVSAAGGLGFLAAGYRVPAQVRDEIAAVRAATDAPFGVNLFVPEAPGDADAAAVETYRASLEGEARRYGVALGDATYSDDHWAEKLALVAQARVPVVSFTFGCPGGQDVRALHDAGSRVVVTVTTVQEARAAADAGADALVVQGPEAGGHRGVFGTAEPGRTPLLGLVEEVRGAVRLPLIAAGGLTDAAAVQAAFAAGADAVQAGTAFLLCPEAGTSAVHRAALVDPAYDATAVTRAFSGRAARGLVNRFMREHGDAAPWAYPQVNAVTAPVRRAAAEARDAGGMSLWAGTEWRRAVAAPAAEVVAGLRG